MFCKKHNQIVLPSDTCELFKCGSCGQDDCDADCCNNCRHKNSKLKIIHWIKDFIYRYILLQNNKIYPNNLIDWFICFWLWAKEEWWRKNDQ